MSDSQAGGDYVSTGGPLTLALHAIAVVAVFLVGLVPGLGMLALWFLLLLGVTQLVYMVPAILIARRRGYPNTAKGLIIGVAVTFMLSAACWALLNPRGLQDLLRLRF